MNIAPIHITNWFIHNGIKSDSPLTHMQVQKFTYLTHGFWLQTNDDSILTEDPEVWPYGPVFESVWSELRGNRGNEIVTIDPNADMIQVSDVISLAERVWNKYGSMSGGQLSELTHRKGSPWQQVAQNHNYRVPRNTPIPVELIKEHYRTVVSRLP